MENRRDRFCGSFFKDLPTDDVPGADIVCFPKREDPEMHWLQGGFGCVGKGSFLQDQITVLENVDFIIEEMQTPGFLRWNKESMIVLSLLWQG